MFGGGELADIGADFAEEGEDGLDADTLHRGEIHPEFVEEVVAHRFVHFLGSPLRGRWWSALTVVIEGIHTLLDLLFAVGHEALMNAPCFEGLTQLRGRVSMGQAPTGESTPVSPPPFPPPSPPTSDLRAPHPIPNS